MARWRDLLTPDGGVDLAVATWFDVSGHRLHYPRGDATFTVEPVVGPDPDVTSAALESLLNVSPASQVLVAEWTGYGRVDTHVDGADYEGVQEFLRPAHVWALSHDLAMTLALRADSSSRPDVENVIPDRIWTPAGSWVLATDTDLASSYCGSVLDMSGRWAPSLEWVEVQELAPIS